MRRTNNSSKFNKWNIYNNISSCSYFLDFTYKIYQQSKGKFVFFPDVEHIVHDDLFFSEKK